MSTNDDFNYMTRELSISGLELSYEITKNKVIAALTNGKDVSEMSKVLTAQRHLTDLIARASSLDAIVRKKV
jgi:hypothetical protein